MATTTLDLGTWQQDLVNEIRACRKALGTLLDRKIEIRKISVETDMQSVKATPVCEGGRAKSLGGPFDLNPFERLLEDALLRTPHVGRDRERLIRQCLTELDKIQTPDMHTIDGSRQAAELILATARKIEEDGRLFREFLETRVQAIVTQSVLAMHTARRPQAHTEDS